MRDDPSRGSGQGGDADPRAPAESGLRSRCSMSEKRNLTTDVHG